MDGNAQNTLTSTSAAIIRLHQMHQMRTVETDISVAWCVSLSVSLTRACALQKQLYGCLDYLFWAQ